MSSISDEGFVQDYQLRKKQELWLYCRLCRTTFPVVFKPKNSKVKLKCICGFEAALEEMDVFTQETDAREHAAFYERIYQAAKGALKDAGIPLPPSGKWSRVEDIAEDSGFESYFNAMDDASAIRDGYIEPDDSDISPAGIAACLMEFDQRLAALDEDDALGRHDLLSELVTWAYCRRHINPEANRRFKRACQDDINLAPRVIVAAKQAKREGRKVRLSFNSFKHLVIALEEDGDLEKALVVAQKASNLGLKSYDGRVAALREKLGL